MTSQSGLTVRLRRLSLVEEGEELLVGDPETGRFISVPSVGGVVIRALERGATIEQTAREAEDFAGQPVDVPGFVETLRELGFVAVDDHERLPVRSAPVQGRRWRRYGIRPALVRPLFGRAAWTIYGACALFNVAALSIASGQLWPRAAEDAFVFDDIGLSALVFMPLAFVLLAAHESWHLLAARAAGVSARFGIDRRMLFLVFETDLSQLWSLPRRHRYGPLLAGLALDSVLLSVVLAARLALAAGAWNPPPLVASVLALAGFLAIVRMVLQCMIFLRTDLYAVFVTATGARNLWRVKTLMLRQAFGRLTPAQAVELSAADPTDIRIGRWFRWLWLAGFLLVTAWFFVFLAPAIGRIAEWAGDGTSFGPASWEFWYRFGCAALLLAPLAAAAVLALRNFAHGVAAAYKRRR